MNRTSGPVIYHSHSVRSNDPKFLDKTGLGKQYRHRQKRCLIRVYTVYHSVCIFWTHDSVVKRYCSNFRIITAIFWMPEIWEFVWYLQALLFGTPVFFSLLLYSIIHALKSLHVLGNRVLDFEPCIPGGQFCELTPIIGHHFQNWLNLLQAFKKLLERKRLQPVCKYMNTWVGSFNLKAIWATTWQNQQNECAQRRLRSAWASAQSEQS